jgi:hypothetical protein
MDMLYRMIWILFLCVTAGGCANVNTLARSSSIPTLGKGKAIHLDAQQRLVVFTAMKYCAEPSPDALAAYAAALGFSGSKLPGDSLAASGALNSVAGSIGLRTQSITLMRDTLYRNCEAALNGYLGPEQMAVLMSRSQDLTAVILAIEQLTGAVAAPPVTLNTGGSSSSASTLMANTEALKAAEEQLTKTKKARDEAEQKKNDLQTVLNQRKTEAATARQAAIADPSKEGEAKQKEDARELAQKEYDAANSLFDQANRNHTLQQDTTDRIKALRDSSVNVANASVSGSASTGSVVVHPSRLTDTKDLADTVDKMIERYLHKDYFADACIATLLKPNRIDDIEASVLNQLGYKALQALSRAKSPTDEISQSNPQIEENQRALSVVCLRYFAQFRPHYGAESSASRETPPGAPGTPVVQPSQSAKDSFDAYRDETAKQAKAIIDQAIMTTPQKPKE